jgi:hypothetical protein
MKNISLSPAWDDTPRTNALVQEIQSTPIPFDIGYWRLLELTRLLEFENNKLRKPQKPKGSGGCRPRQARKEVVAKKQQGRPKAKRARDRTPGTLP